MPVSPSATVTSSIEAVGSGSLSVIVPMPVPSEMVALTGLDRRTSKFSSNSSSRSPATDTTTVLESWPGVNVSVVVGCAV